MKNYFEAITRDNAKVLIKKEDISVIEEVPSSARVDGYLKLYISGYSFSLKMTMNELTEKLEEH